MLYLELGARVIFEARGSRYISEFELREQSNPQRDWWKGYPTRRFIIMSKFVTISWSASTGNYVRYDAVLCCRIRTECGTSCFANPSDLIRNVSASLRHVCFLSSCKQQRYPHHTISELRTLPTVLARRLPLDHFLSLHRKCVCLLTTTAVLDATTAQASLPVHTPSSFGRKSEADGMAV